MAVNFCFYEQIVGYQGEGNLGMDSNILLKDHQSETRLFLSRLIIAAFFVLVLMVLLVGRLIQLQVIDYQRFSELSQGNRLRIEPLPPTRGLVFDRNGVLLAENLPTWQLVMIPEEVEDLENTLVRLEALGLTNSAEHQEIVDLVRSRRDFERVQLRNLSEADASRFAVRRHQFPGVDIQEGLIRHYPFGAIGAHTIGYVGSISPEDLKRIDRSNYAGTSQIGRSGIERSYEQSLHGEVGYRQQVVNAQGRILLDPTANRPESTTELSQNNLETKWPVPGDNLILGLDVKLQLVAQEAMAGFRGAAIAIEPKTGDVLTLVSVPSFDPNRFTAGLSRADFTILGSDPDNPLFNRAIAGTYPPGSTVKPFFGIAALKEKAIDPAHREICPGFFSLPGDTHRYRDWKAEGHGPMDLHDALVQSCDVFFYQVALSLGIDRLGESLENFGFGSTTGLDVVGEGHGIVPSREWKKKNFSRREDQVWFPGETLITGIGQGFALVTPLQLAHASAVLGTHGKRFKPRLVIGTQKSVSGQSIWLEPEGLAGPANVESEHYQKIHQAMLGVIEETAGTGHNAMLDTPYRVAGKTGTAQVFSLAQEEEYDEESIDERLRDHALFVAFAPAEDPEIAVAVVVENGGSSGTAATVVRKILDAFLLGVDRVPRQP